MAPPPPFSLGPAEVQPAPPPPLDPSALNALIEHAPAHAAAILDAMRPRQRDAQAKAHATLAGLPGATIAQQWDALIVTHSPLPPDPVPFHTDAPGDPGISVFEPEVIGIADPAEARKLIATLTESQKLNQAIAQAAWMSQFGYDVTWMDYMVAWESHAEQRRAE
jgi:hypothetical protein